MRLLLDTHVWIWSLFEPDRLARPALDALSLEESEIWLSSVSVWETVLLLERGRLHIREPADPLEAVGHMLEATPAREAPLSHAIALESRRLELPHEDPADRFIAATARVYGLTLVTADRRLLEAPTLNTLAGS